MSKTLYLECSSGISGDMTVAALLDLGANQQKLQAALASLPVHGYDIKVSRVSKSGLDACDFAVLLDHAHENHDHDMNYLHGHDHAHEHHHHDHEHSHEHEHHHHHEHDQNHHHAHEHRGLPEILHILEHGDLTDRARALAVKIFEILAAAESKAHGVPMNEVHFHEVGAVDSIVDIVAAAVCLDDLDITEVIIPQLNEGSGFIRCQHGMIPVPVPATLNIAQAHGLPLHLTTVQGELVTPTGAAIAAAIRTSGQLPTQFRVEKIGIGAGKRTYERPSLLRAMLITAQGADCDRVWQLETTIDDCTGEALGYTLERLMDCGARDAFYTAVQMKKSRPAWLLTVLCDEAQLSTMEQIIFEETTTIGIRRVQVERTVLRRHLEQVETPLGTVTVKVCTLPNGAERRYPEYDSLCTLAQAQNLPIQAVIRQITAFIG